MNTERVLLVDDDPNILNAFKRQLRNNFVMETSSSGDDALGIAKSKGPFAVVMVDMQMPGMNGIEVLQRFKRDFPDTVRIMLTGNVDQETSVRALNEGSIYRFLNKPCSSDDVGKVLLDAISQYRVEKAERELLAKTLSGSVKVLTDMLSLLVPESFEQGLQARELVRQLGQRLSVSNTWEIELALMLVPLGELLLPPALARKLRSGERLGGIEAQVANKLPATVKSLIANIPRLEGVSQLVYLQSRNFDGSGGPSDEVIKGEQLPLGARIVRVVRDFKAAEARGLKGIAACCDLRRFSSHYDPNVLVALEQIQSGEVVKAQPEAKTYKIKVEQLCAGHKLLSAVQTSDGVLLMGAGATVTQAMVEKIQNYAQLVGVKQPIEVESMMPLAEVK